MTLRPFGRPPNGNSCPWCARGLASGYIPVDKSTNLQHRIKYCEVCKIGWSEVDKATDYRMFKVSGKWRARPR